MFSLVCSDITSLSPHDIKGNNKLVRFLLHIVETENLLFFTILFVRVRT